MDFSIQMFDFMLYFSMTKGVCMAGFGEILGHDSIKRHLKRAVETGMVSHAYILNGEDGMGKRSLACAFALNLLCENQKGEACMECHACRQVLSGNHPDLIFVTHEKPNSIGVDDVREQVNDTIRIMPYSSSYKIYIIDESEKMTVQAQNALLKTIEEPPSYGVLILLTTSQEAFLPTILSRCIQLKLKPLRDDTVQNYLIEKLQVEEGDAGMYTAFAQGNLGKAISIAASEDFRIMLQGVLDLMKKIGEMDISELLDYIRRVKEDKLDAGACLDFMQLWYRDVLLYKVTQDRELLIFKEEYRHIEEISGRSAYDGLERILNAITRTRMRLNSNVNMELAMEFLLLVMKENLGIRKTSQMNVEKGEYRI